MTDRTSIEIDAGNPHDAEEFPCSAEKSTSGTRAEDILGYWPEDEIDEHEEARRAFVRSALRARRRIVITRDPVEIYTGDPDYAEDIPRPTEKLTGGMRGEDIFGCCTAYEFEGLEEVRRMLRWRDLSRKPKV